LRKICNVASAFSNFSIHFLELFSSEKIKLKIMWETVDFMRLARILQLAKKTQNLYNNNTFESCEKRVFI